MRNIRRLTFTLCCSLAAAPALAQTFSGQVAFGQSTVEPAFNLADGSYVFLLTPDHVAIPSHANQRAWAPLYIVAYPPASSISPATLNCTPTNCDHVQSLPNLPPFLASVYPGGQLIGHDHLVGVAPTGDFNVAWAVKLVLFTPKGVADHAIDTPIRTLEELDAAMANEDVTQPIDTPIVFNCSIVSQTVYTKAQ